MKTLVHGVLLTALAVALVVVPQASVQQAAAQAPRPVLVVSVNGVDGLFADIDYVTKVAGAEAYGQIAKGMMGIYTAGIDKSKVWGVIVTTDGQSFKPLGFVPVKDLQVQLAALKEQFGEPKDAGNGVLELAGPTSVFVKEQAGWAFLAQDAASLGNLPNDPTTLLGGLDKSYDIGVRAFVRAIPDQYRQMAVSQLRAGFEQQLQGLDDDDPQTEVQRKMLKRQMEQLITVMNDLDELTIGFSIDETARKLFLDFTVTAVPETKTATQFAMLEGLQSAFSGFQVPGAAVTLGLTSKLAPADIDQAVAMFESVRINALKEIDKDKNLPNDQAKAAAKDVLTSVMEVLAETIKSGRIDGGATLMLGEGSLSGVAGGYVADSAKAEAAFRKLVTLAEKEPDFPGVKFNAATHQNVNFHTMRVPIPEKEEEARKILGENLDVAIGFGPQSFYVAMGKDPLALVQKVMEGSAAGAGQPTLPMQLNISLGTIMEFAAATGAPNPIVGMMAEVLKKSAGNDHISVRVTPIRSGAQYRIEVEEGVIKAIGQSAQMGAGAGGGF